MAYDKELAIGFGMPSATATSSVQVTGKPAGDLFR
jgi:hypothetical protein